MSDIETVRNLHPDPRCLRPRATWNGVLSEDGEKRRYEIEPNASNGSVFCWEPFKNSQLSGRVLYARITDATQSLLDNLNVEQAGTLVRRDGWIAAGVGDTNTGNHTITLQRGAFTLCEVGVYTPEDWKRLYAAYQAGRITYPWVAGPRDATTAGQIGPWEL